MRFAWIGAALAVALVIPACGDDDPKAADGTEAADPSCEAHRPARGAAPPAGLVQPEGTLVLEPYPAAGDGTPVEVHGFVDRGPSEVVADLSSRPSVRVQDQDDEGFEAEIELRSGGYANSWRLRRVCQRGSVATITIRPGSG